MAYNSEMNCFQILCVLYGRNEQVMKLIKLDHIQLAMPPGEEDKARVFYSTLLALPEKIKPAPLAKRGGVWFEREDLKVHLGVEHDFRPAKKAHPAFLVDDLTLLIQQCLSAGYEVIEVNPDEVFDNHKRAYIFDPFGNRLEFLEMMPI